MFDINPNTYTNLTSQQQAHYRAAMQFIIDGEKQEDANLRIEFLGCAVFHLQSAGDRLRARLFEQMMVGERIAPFIYRSKSIV